MKDRDYRKRKGCGIKWRMVHPSCLGETEITGYDIDNLDTKTLDDAVTPFEELFINIREVLEENESRCADNVEDRLELCQVISDRLWGAFRASLKNA